MLCTNISEILFLGELATSPIKVGDDMDGEQIKEFFPIFNPEGALIAIRVIGTSGRDLRLLTTYGVVCSLKADA